MSNEPLPDGIAEGETAYVVVDNQTPGVGSWPTAHRVKVTRITATQVRVTGNYTGGPEMTFRRRDLTRPSSARRYTLDDRLAARNDPDVRKAHLIAEVFAAVDKSRELVSGSTRSTMRGFANITPARLAKDIPGNVDLMLNVLAELRDEVAQAHIRLSHVREALS